MRFRWGPYSRQKQHSLLGEGVPFGETGCDRMSVPTGHGDVLKICLLLTKVTVPGGGGAVHVRMAHQSLKYGEWRCSYFFFIFSFPSKSKMFRGNLTLYTSVQACLSFERPPEHDCAGAHKARQLFL